MSLELSQLIIILAMLAFGFYVFSARTVLRDRIIYFILVSAGVILALYPNFSTRLANAIGIGRGTDLILYIFIIFSLFYYTSLASQFKKIEQQLTTLTRAIAIQHALNNDKEEIGCVSSEATPTDDST